MPFDPSPIQANFSSLAQLQAAGYVVDEWDRWQQGHCGTYAVALLNLNPTLRLGTLGVSYDEGSMVIHHFAHDAVYAYDSAGRHPLPYRHYGNTWGLLLHIPRVRRHPFRDAAPRPAVAGVGVASLQEP